MKHVVLLGDSIFDNKAYINGGLDVIAQLALRIPPGWEASLLAIDGSVVDDVRMQASDLPDDATHLIISAGGNNAIINAGILMVFIRDTKDSYRVINVEDWVVDDESLEGKFGY